MLNIGIISPPERNTTAGVIWLFLNRLKAFFQGHPIDRIGMLLAEFRQQPVGAGVIKSVQGATEKRAPSDENGRHELA